MTYEELRERVARDRCRRLGTAQCAAICLTHFSTSTRDGQCPEAVRVHGKNVSADLAVIREAACGLHESIDPASDMERLRGDPGAGAMGAVIEYRDKLRRLLGGGDV